MGPMSQSSAKASDTAAAEASPATPPPDPQASEPKAGSGKKAAGKQATSEKPQAAPLTGEELETLALRLEAALMTSDRAVSAAKLSEILGDIGQAAIRQAVDALNSFYDQTRRSFRIEQLAGGYQVMTRPEYAQVLEHLSRSRADSRLSPAAMETLAIIAYKQPIIRADIESIRGVATGEVLKSLLERQLIKIVGRAEQIGRPMLYGTTQRFLEVFGLASLKDLPPVEPAKARASASL